MLPSPANMHNNDAKKFFERIPNIVYPKRSRLAHLHGLPKTHRQQLSLA